MIFFVGGLSGFTATLAIILGILSYRLDEKERKQMDEEFQRQHDEIFGKN